LKQSLPIKTFSINKTQWNFIIFNQLSQITGTTNTKMNEGCWHSYLVRRFYHFLLWRREFYFDDVGNFEPKKLNPNCDALAKSIISHLGV